LAKRARGRPAKWCSQACRRAAYEERRAAASGAIAVELVEVVNRVEARTHGIGTCVDTVLESPAACRRVLNDLAVKVSDGSLEDDPKWASTLSAVHRLAERAHAGSPNPVDADSEANYALSTPIAGVGRLTIRRSPRVHRG